jgi:hypothetical protein
MRSSSTALAKHGKTRPSRLVMNGRLSAPNNPQLLGFGVQFPQDFLPGFLPGPLRFDAWPIVASMHSGVVGVGRISTRPVACTGSLASTQRYARHIAECHLLLACISQLANELPAHLVTVGSSPSYQAFSGKEKACRPKGRQAKDGDGRHTEENSNLQIDQTVNALLEQRVILRSHNCSHRLAGMRSTRAKLSDMFAFCIH